jgi:DNA helicase-2/ATP-dependent DNA helicase PcrA
MSYSRSYGIEDNFYTPRATRHTQYAKPTTSFGGYSAAKKTVDASTCQYSVGQRVEHKTFGEGLILSSSPMGNDTLLEIAFDTVGTKKLMAAYAKLKVL